MAHGVWHIAYATHTHLDAARDLLHLGDVGVELEVHTLHIRAPTLAGEQGVVRGRDGGGGRDGRGGGGGVDLYEEELTYMRRS